MLTIHHLYADMMNLYGDRGNVISIRKRCEWRGIPVEVVDVGLGGRVRPTGCDLFLFGGGQDREQARLADDLSGSKGADLRAIAEDDGVVLGVCGGYQLMGLHYETPEGEKLPGVGIFDLHTEPRQPAEPRLVGEGLGAVRGGEGPRGGPAPPPPPSHPPPPPAAPARPAAPDRVRPGRRPRPRGRRRTPRRRLR